MSKRQAPLPDIVSGTDIRVIVDEFYGRMKQDPLLAQTLEAAKVDEGEFISVMCNFWNTMLLRSGNYHGKPYPKHEPLGLTKAHFERWKILFFDTIDAHFAGAKAEELKQWVEHIGKVFQERLAAANLLVPPS